MFRYEIENGIDFKPNISLRIERVGKPSFKRLEQFLRPLLDSFASFFVIFALNEKLELVLESSPWCLFRKSLDKHEKWRGCSE